MSDEKCCCEPEPEPCCGGAQAETTCCGGAGEPVLSVTYDAPLHAVASHLTLDDKVGLVPCGAFGGEATEMNPIDLLAWGMAGCLLIVMGKAAQARNLCILGAKADVSYELANYKISAINVNITLPKAYSAADQARLEAASKACPIYLAMHPEVAVRVNYLWPT